ncbi:MAG TPA: S-methyl-5-thioribose-1-phosphate isomerase [Acidobacteriota bacterium]|nr:S-methyl-5-thioribose-1-phosphate isomerase [Acidobacteriota bacterium]
MIEPIAWRNGAVVLLDQRALPGEEIYLSLHSAEQVIEAIRDLVVRGAPAIGVTAALGLAMESRRLSNDPAVFRDEIDALCQRFEAARPTAVNLAWAIGRLRRTVDQALSAGVDAARDRLLEAALLLLHQDVEVNRRLGAHGIDLVPDDARVMTHCNAGALATAGYGTALGVVRAAVDSGRRVHVIANETRPFLQGARLTAWEMQHDGIPCTVITDNMAGHMMQRGSVDVVVVGADRVAANGDVANKIGTYSVAVLAREHGIPFYVAVPTSTIDLDSASGSEIPIEERDGEEVLVVNSVRIAPQGVLAEYPAFDVTPARLVTAIITETGVARPPYSESLRACCRRSEDP